MRDAWPRCREQMIKTATPGLMIMTGSVLFADARDSIR